MERNETILRMDLRLTECGQEAEYCIDQILNKNREKSRSLAIRSQENSKINMQVTSLKKT